MRFKLIILSLVLVIGACDTSKTKEDEQGAGTTVDPTITPPVEDKLAPTTSASPQGGRYSGDISVELKCVDNNVGCKDTYFTLDGSTPRAVDDQKYRAKIAISANTTLKYFSVNNNGNIEIVKVEQYQIGVVGGSYNNTCRFGTSVIDNCILGSLFHWSPSYRWML